MTPGRHLLVVGCGSVGKRHAANLHALGCRITGVDPRPDRLEELASRVPVEGRFTVLADALALPFDAAVIASPPSEHVDQALACLDRRLPFLLEKPVAPDLASALRLMRRAEDCGIPVLLGYTFRWWDPIREFRQRLIEGKVGRPLRVQMVLAAHLADWHPWERYQDFFMASAALGGGALLDESHFLDLLIWLFGWPRDLSATVERLSGLEISTDDNVEVNAMLESGIRASIHLDLYSRPHERSIRVAGDAGSLEWLNETNEVRWSADPTNGWVGERFSCERNDMFVAEARHFLDVLAGAVPGCNLRDGCRVMQLVETIRTSSRERRTVPVPAPL